MIYALVTLSFITAFSMILLCRYAKRAEKAAFSLFNDRYNEIAAKFERPEDDKPSEFEQTLIEFSQIIGQNVAASMKGSFAGALSGLKRQENAITEAIIEDQLDQKSPLLSAGMELLGGKKVKKTLAKHPEWLGALVNMAGNGGLNLGLGAAPGNNNGSSSSYGDSKWG